MISSEIAVSSMALECEVLDHLRGMQRIAFADVFFVNGLEEIRKRPSEVHFAHCLRRRKKRGQIVFFDEIKRPERSVSPEGEFHNYVIACVFCHVNERTSIVGFGKEANTDTGSGLLDS